MSNSAKAQRLKILDGLKKAGPKGLTTLQIRENLDAMHAGGRVMELRRQGHVIHTIWTIDINAQGHAHRVARYVLMREKVAA
ncbi:MAG: hypothetical protein ACJA05_000106 [Porticoccus sp.]|jgi:hypothetical protein|uniref:helix-turn-helix domain-containing protein n=1 Tax=Porticoccus sp. TaxID=2024853 RepID=UPI0039E513BE|tara:strand:+ start:781 stop:1026 length:246 start_codon:yes stop_codon:yes gene_type:complete